MAFGRARDVHGDFWLDTGDALMPTIADGLVTKSLVTKSLVTKEGRLAHASVFSL